MATTKDYVGGHMEVIGAARGDSIRDAVWGVMSDLEIGRLSPAEADKLLDLCASRAAMHGDTGGRIKGEIARIRYAVAKDTEAAVELASDLCRPYDSVASADTAEEPADPAEFSANLHPAPEILMLDPEELMPHPLLARMTMLDTLAGKLRQRAKKAGHNRANMVEAAEEAEASFAALKASVAAQGVLEPLLVVETDDGRYKIIDGRHRWTAALAAGLPAVPCIARAEAEAGQIIADAVTGRRHFSKSALAWIAVITHQEIATDGADRKAGNLRNGAKSPIPTKYVSGEKGHETQEEVAIRHGVSLPLLAQACELYRLCEQWPELAPDAEMTIWAGAGLGGVLAGLKSQIAGGGTKNQDSATKKAQAAWSYLDRAYGQLGAAWARWDAMPPDHQELSAKRIAKQIAGAPERVRREIQQALESL